MKKELKTFNFALLSEKESNAITGGTHELEPIMNQLPIEESDEKYYYRSKINGEYYSGTISGYETRD